MNQYLSPLRYPGGKGIIAPFISDLVLFNNLENSTYYEPYAGGAGVGLYLLLNGFVNEIFLNDADSNIYAFWDSLLNNTTKFIKEIDGMDISMDTWIYYKNIIDNNNDCTIFEIGLAFFFLNRCNRSGIVKNAGPIGGYNQKGKWKLDVRFNKKGLIKRIQKISKYKESIHFYNQDAIKFLESTLPDEDKHENAFVYLDPPYYAKGKMLYLNFYSTSDHIKLSQYIKKQSNLNWMITYDNEDAIKELYSTYNIIEYDLKYSLQNKRKGKEIIILPSRVHLPMTIRVGNQEILLDSVSE